MKITAEELRSRYAAGERDFSGSDLIQIGVTSDYREPSLDAAPNGRTSEFCTKRVGTWAEGMLAKLKAGTAKGRPDWCSKTETSVEALVLHLFAEIHELLASSTMEERMREAADVANVVHMLAEHIGNDTTTAARALAAAKMVRQTYVG